MVRFTGRLMAEGVPVSMDFSFVDPWHLFLPRDGGHVLSIMGSGGKTSLLRVLAATYEQLGIPVIMTTTTKTEPLVGIAERSLTAAGSGLPPVVYLHAGELPQGKWAGLAPEAVDHLEDRLPGRIVLAEVDGAAKMPVKCHRPGEPVWPGRTSLAFVVMGTSALGRPLRSVLQRWDQPAAAALVHNSADRPWAWDDFFQLLTMPGGYLDQVPVSVPAVLVLSGMDELADSIGLFAFLDRVMAEPRLPLILLAGLQEGQSTLRTVCRQEGGSDRGY